MGSWVYGFMGLWIGKQSLEMDYTDTTHAYCGCPRRDLTLLLLHYAN